MKSLLKKILFITLFLFPIIPSIEAVTDEIIDGLSTVVEQGYDRQICDFDPARDTEEVLEIFKDNWHWLMPDEEEDFSEKLALDLLINGESEEFRPYVKVLREQNKLVGFTSYYMENEQLGHVEFLAVDQKSRCKGFGEELIRYAIKDLGSMGANCVELDTIARNVPAQQLYKKVGFDKIDFDEIECECGKCGEYYTFSITLGTNIKNPNTIDDPLAYSRPFFAVAPAAIQAQAKWMYGALAVVGTAYAGLVCRDKVSSLSEIGKAIVNSPYVRGASKIAAVGLFGAYLVLNIRRIRGENTTIRRIAAGVREENFDGLEQILQSQSRKSNE